MRNRDLFHIALNIILLGMFLGAIAWEQADGDRTYYCWPVCS